MDLTPLNNLLKERPELGPLAFKESSGFADARRVNADDREFAGLFQIGAARLQDLKEDGVVPEDATLQTLMDDPALYARAADAHFDDYRQAIRNPDWKWNSYVGTEVDGIPITETGMIYAMHIGGRNGTEKFLRTGADPADELGTNISDYMRLGAQVEAVDPSVMTVARVRMRDRVAAAANVAPAVAAVAARTEDEETDDPELQELREVEPEQPPPEEPPEPDEVDDGVMTVADQPSQPSQRPPQPADRRLVRSEIEGPDSNPLIPIMREMGFNQADNYPLSRLLRQGYTTTQMVNSLVYRRGMDPRWESMVEQAREYGISDDVILGAMIGADDRKTIAMIEGAARGGTIAAGSAAGAVLGGKIGMLAGPAGAIIGTIAGAVGGGIGTAEVIEAVGPEITQYTPQARVVYNAAETAASIIGVTPAFRRLPSGMKAIREMRVEAAKRLAREEGRDFDESLVQASRMERILNAVARNIGEKGTTTRRMFNVSETLGAGLGAAAAAGSQMAFPENPWPRLAAEIGSGLSAASLTAIGGGLFDAAKQVIAGYSVKGASAEGMRLAVAEFMANGNAVVTPRVFREGLSAGEQQKVLRGINASLSRTGSQIESVEEFLRLPDEMQTRLLTGTDGEWAFKATISRDNFVKASREARAEMLRSSGPALLQLVKRMSEEGQRVGFSPSATQFMPEELMKIAEGMARTDPQFGSRLSAQKLSNLQEMVNAMRLLFDSIAPGTGARKEDMAQLLALRDELFTQVHQEMLRSVDRRAAEVIAARKQPTSEIATDFTETVVNLYNRAYSASKGEADRLYDLVDNNQPIQLNFFRGQAKSKATRTLYGPQLPSMQDQTVRSGVRATKPKPPPEMEGLEPGEAREYLEALVTDLQANRKTLTSSEKEVLTESKKLLKQFQDAGKPVAMKLRQVRRLREVLRERSRKEFVANGGPTSRSRYYRLMANALDDDLDAAADASNITALRTANAFYRTMQETFTEGLGDTVAKYLNPFDKSPRNPSVLIDAIIPSNAANVSVRLQELDDIVTFLQNDLLNFMPDAREAMEVAIDAAGKRDQILQLSAKLLSQRAIKSSARSPTDPVTVDDIDTNILSDIRIEYGPVIERMPVESRALFEDAAEAAKAINRDRQLLGDIGSKNVPLSSAFGTEDPAFDDFIRVLSRDGNLLGDSKFPVKYASSASGSELLALLSDSNRVLNPIMAFNDFTRLVGRLASEADNGPLSEQVLQRILQDPRFEGFSELLTSLKNPSGQSVELRKVAESLDSLRYPLGPDGKPIPGAAPSGERLRNGLKRAFADFALTYDKSQNVSFKALADRALLAVGSSKAPTESIDDLFKKPVGSRSQQESMLDIMQKNGIITAEQKTGIENFLHFGAQAENILYNTVPTDPEGGFEAMLTQRGLIDTAIRSAGASMGSLIGRLLGNQQSLVSAYAGSRVALNAFNKVPIAHAQQVLKDVLLNNQFRPALEVFLKQIDDVKSYQQLSSTVDRLAASFYTPRITSATLQAFRNLPPEFYEQDTTRIPTQDELRNKEMQQRQQERAVNRAPTQAAAPARPARPPMFAPPPPQPAPLNFQQDFPELFAQQQPQQAAPSGPANPMAGAQLFPNDPMFQQRGIQALMQG